MLSVFFPDLEESSVAGIILVRDLGLSSWSLMVAVTLLWSVWLLEKENETTF